MSSNGGASYPAGAGSEFPHAFYTIIRAIDSFSDVTGRLIALSMLFLVAIISYEVVMRYGFNAPTVWVYEFELHGQRCGLHARLRIRAL